MSIINYAARVINFKVVYYGPGWPARRPTSSTSTAACPTATTGKMISLATGDDRTLFFDFLPVSALSRARLHHALPALHGARARCTTT